MVPHMWFPLIDHGFLGVFDIRKMGPCNPTVAGLYRGHQEVWHKMVARRSLALRIYVWSALM